ncbi:MAG TPA: sigma-54 dependent transcriptional regulator [Terriglobales bacterium]|nr:sigma-54 dependent transcriptional regulator [Terriglobales bacterium]
MTARTAATSAAEGPTVNQSVVIFTTDTLVPPEAEQYLAPHFETMCLDSWDGTAVALERLAPNALLLDIDTVGESTNDGLRAVQQARELLPDIVLFALTRSGSRHLRLKAEQAGADEYFVAPLDFRELRIVLRRALDKRTDELENRRVQEEIASKQTFCELIGGSEEMLRVYEAIERVAASNTTVLIRGESGTGKELVARAIVTCSPRAEKPFISINCSALPDTLIETELFGHEKGAYTDAREARAGHIELAHSGTLFLDEIATLGLPLQSKLLRVLEDRTVTRIGGKTAKKIDFRLIAATNEDLEEMVQAGRFREDLYYRINVVPIGLPPLRERPDDIPILIDHFLRRYCAANNVPLKHIDPEVLEVLEQDQWPGNVRELENLIQRLVLMADGPSIKMRHLPQRILYNSAASQESILIPEGGIHFDEEMERIEAAYVRAALRRTGGKKTAAAELLRINPQKMKYLCRKHNLTKV